MASYIELMTVKLVRKKHKVSFVAGNTVAEVIQAMLKVPAGSTVEELTVCEDVGKIDIIFHHESLDADQQK